MRQNAPLFIITKLSKIFYINYDLSHKGKMVIFKKSLYINNKKINNHEFHELHEL